MRDAEALDRALDAVQIIVGALIVVPMVILAAPLWVPLACIVRFFEWYTGGRDA